MEQGNLHQLNNLDSQERSYTLDVIRQIVSMYETFTQEYLDLHYLVRKLRGMRSV